MSTTFKDLFNNTKLESFNKLTNFRKQIEMKFRKELHNYLQKRIIENHF